MTRAKDKAQPTAAQQQLIEKLRTLCGKWRRRQKEIGLVLLDLDRSGYPVELAIRAVLNKEFGIGVDEAWCCLRWARGDFGVHGAALMARVGNKAVLRAINKEVLADEIAKPSPIESRHAKRLVWKRLLDMSDAEICDHLTRTGVQRKRRHAAVRTRRLRATEHEVRNGSFILKGGPHCNVQMVLSREMYEVAKRYFESTAPAV